jgi:hypothetical protein
MTPARPNAPKPGPKRFLRILFRSSILYAASVSVATALLSGIMRAAILYGPSAEGEVAPALVEIGSLAALVFFVFAGVGFCVGWSWAIYHATVKRMTAFVAYVAGGPIGGLVLLLFGQMGSWASNCVFEPAMCAAPEINIRLGYVAIASAISYSLIAFSRLSIAWSFRYFTWPID